MFRHLALTLGVLGLLTAPAQAAGRTGERGAGHCPPQHDAPGCDFQADDVLKKFALGGKLFDPIFARKAIADVAAAVRASLKKPLAVTHVGTGKAKVEQVASTRRVMGPDGKVKYVRYSATRDAKIRAEPEGLIDPYVQVLSFWDGDTPLVAISYYATHPQSYYGKGGVSSDFPGLARGLCDKRQPNVMHIHFNGAGGNVTAGKYNDGAVDNRPVLAERLAKGMRAAFDATQKTPIEARDVTWRSTAVALPLSKLYRNRAELEARM